MCQIQGVINNISVCDKWHPGNNDFIFMEWLQVSALFLKSLSSPFIFPHNLGGNLFSKLSLQSWLLAPTSSAFLCRAGCASVCFETRQAMAWPAGDSPVGSWTGDIWSSLPTSTSVFLWDLSCWDCTHLMLGASLLQMSVCLFPFFIVTFTRENHLLLELLMQLFWGWLVQYSALGYRRW